jgi:hypothetical protein
VAGGTLHEDLRREDQAAAPSERKFGLTLGGILALIAIVKLIERSPWGLLWGALAIVLIGGALWRPQHLAMPNRIWLKLGLVLHRIVNPVIMAILFYGTLLPIGLLMRLLGKDPLRLRLDKKAVSYWLTRSDERPPSEAMRQQF